MPEVVGSLGGDPGASGRGGSTHEVLLVGGLRARSRVTPDSDDLTLGGDESEAAPQVGKPPLAAEANP